MSGDVQPRKRKDKKRKKDDEDTVKETPAPKVTAGAAQAATQPGDIQMHVHNDHGTGGHWCAKVVFFILLTGLGALIGLIILENRGVSNADTPLSESRYAEYFDGWVDENREDDHHHEEILEALNQLDEHEDEEHGDHGGDDHGEEEEEDDGAPYAEEEDHDEERELEDEEDEGELPKLDDDEVEEIVATEKKVVRQEAQAAADDEDDDDDTNEGGYEADDDNQADAEEDEEENDEEEDEEEIEYNDEEADDFVDDGGDEDVDDDDDENDKEDDATKTTAKTVDDNDDDDQPDDDDDDNVNDGDDNDDGEDKDTGAGDFGDDGDDDNDDKEPELEQNDDDDDDQNDEDQDDNDQDSDDNHGLNEVDGDNDDDNDNDDGDNVDDEELDNDDDDDNEPAVADRQTDGDADDDDNDNQTADDGDDDDDADEIDQLAGEDDDDDDDTVEGNSPFDEENQTNALNDQANKLRPRDVVQNKTEEVIVDKDAGIEKTVRTRDSMKDETPVEPIVSAELLKTQMDDLVENYNKLAEMMNLPKEETFVQKDPNQVNHKDDDDQVNEDDKKPTTANDNNDDDDEDDDDNDDFENFVDNDGGEEEYLAKLRKEQEQRTQQKQQEEKAEPREESSQSAYQHPSSVDEQEQEATLMGNLSERLLRTEMAAANLVEKAEIIEELLSSGQQPRSVLEDFVNAASSGLEDEEIVEGNVILIEGDDGELYSGDDEYDYELEDDYGEELEEIEEEEEYEEEEERKLVEQELEIGSFVPTTFEEFSSMYRSPSSGETNESIPVPPEPVSEPTPAVVAPEPPIKEFPKSSHKESPLMKKKPPKGALNKLIYGLHKEPLITAEDLQQSIEARAVASTSQSTKEKHVEFILPEQVSEIPSPEEELPMEVPEDIVDNGSKENLFIPYDDDGDIEDSYEDELMYEDEEELDSVLLRQYPSDEEEEPFSDDDLSDVDDSELMRRLEEKYGKLEVKKDPVAQPEDEDEEEGSWTKIPSRPSESQIYEEELNRARRHLDELKNPKKALEEYESLLRKHRSLVPALIGKARALDALAEQQQSNTLLGEAIEAYRDVVFLGKAVDDETVKVAGERCIDRSRFRGQYLKVVDVHQELIRRFDSEPKFRNQLAVTYLLANRLAEAKAVLHETLMRWIDDGFALVHYGFVLKNHDKDMELAAQYLREGIETEQEGTQDGRFYFHLGDALQRLGLQQEALDVYRKGAEKKLFLSMYQRSLYNVDSLKSRPFWTIEQTTYAAQLELIRSQWTAIRDEGLKLLNSAGNFKDEAENLRDTGDWKQFELFFRGHRIDKNCAKAPLTCRLVEQFAAARSCKRGQVKFSVMHPGTHVWPHCGPTNCRIRAHLGLKVPSGTFIRVAEETRSWENGKWLIFDDSFEHEVWHNGTSTRLVLIVDFWHPDLTESQRKSLSPI
ncbi:claspin isoform X2 [Aedes albopictus]|uniref:Aspartyl/asparaginy/proline hydroxylase domain-containing protein n=1 Tax=Aedes albopictus TaxID=7160 RepID=A0ABM1Y3C0_AEDAL